MSGWRWREPVLAVAGIALAVASAGLGMLIANAVADEQQITAYSAEPLDAQPGASAIADKTPEPEPTATRESTVTQQATATRTPTRAATPTRTPIATRTPVATATPTPTRTPTPAPTPTSTPTPVAAGLEKSTFALPGEATPNGGGTIGPFCCQGHTVTVRNSSGTILGYAYWYKWAGQAYNFDRGGAIPDIIVFFHDVSAGQTSVSLSAGEVSAGVSRTVEIGSLRFTVTFNSAEHTTYAGVTYLWESSLTASLAVSLR